MKPARLLPIAAAALALISSSSASAIVYSMASTPCTGRLSPPAQSVPCEGISGSLTIDESRSDFALSFRVERPGPDEFFNFTDESADDDIVELLFPASSGSAFIVVSTPYESFASSRGAGLSIGQGFLPGWQSIVYTTTVNPTWTRVSPVPEPGTLALLGLALAGLAVARRRGRSGI